MSTATTTRNQTAAVRERLAQRRADAQARSSAALAKATAANGAESKAITAKAAEETVRDLIRKMTPEFAKALPSHMSAERLGRIALTEIRRNPSLLSCDQASLLGALMLSAQLGLEPGPLGHCYLIPRKNKHTNRMEVNFQVGYRGYLELLYRSDRVESVFAEIVYEEEKKRGLFKYVRGDNPHIEHVPYLDGPRGKPIGAYVVIRFKGGGSYSHFMRVDDIEARRRRSASPDQGPWVTDWEAMAKKTVLRDAIKWLPLSIEVQRAAAVDEGSVKTVDETGTPVVEAEWELLPDEPDDFESAPEPEPSEVGEQQAPAPADSSTNNNQNSSSGPHPSEGEGGGTDSLPF